MHGMTCCSVHVCWEEGLPEVVVEAEVQLSEAPNQGVETCHCRA